MKTRTLIIIGIIAIAILLSFLYVPAYFDCSEGLQLNLSCSFPDRLGIPPEIRQYTMMKATCNNSEGKPDGECFIKSFEKCESARIKQMSPTMEGDPIFFYATIVPEDSCSIHFEKNISLDKWKGVATPGIILEKCTDAHLSEYYLNLECEYDPHRISLR